MSKPSAEMKLQNDQLLLLETFSGQMLLLLHIQEGDEYDEETYFVRPILTANELHRTCFYERVEIFSILKSDLIFNDSKFVTDAKELSDHLFVAEAITFSDLLEKEKLIGKEKYTIVGKLRGDRNEYPLPAVTNSSYSDDSLKNSCLIS